MSFTPLPATLAGPFHDELEALARAHLLRHRREVAPLVSPEALSPGQEDLRATTFMVDGQVRLSFGGNDYLGLSQHPDLIEAACRAARQYGVGATASPLVCGHGPAHAALERELAALVGLPRALYFYAGYAANVGLVPALAGQGDELFSDALNHACLIDGARLSRASITVVPHRDLGALEQALARSTARRKLVLTDAVFSMDGTVADVPALLQLCERHDAWLVIDDAHGFGVLGEHGEGSLAHFGVAGLGGPSPRWQGRLDRLVYMATLGKAAGVSGAFVAGHASVVEWVMQKARTYMFATGAPPMVAACLSQAVRIIREEPGRRHHLQVLRQRLKAGLSQSGVPWPLWPSDTAIQPLIIGSNEDALSVMKGLEAQGLWVPAIRPPTVPAGTARLRISLSAAHSPAHVDRLVAALAKVAHQDLPRP